MRAFLLGPAAGSPLMREQIVIYISPRAFELQCDARMKFASVKNRDWMTLPRARWGKIKILFAWNANSVAIARDA